MTRLEKPVARLTNKRFGQRPVVITIAPAGSQDEALIELRLKGQRTGFLVALSDLYRVAALWHGQKVAKAKREARKAGIPWKQAVKSFNRSNRI